MSFANAAVMMMGAGAVNSAIGAYYGAASQKRALGLQAGLDDANARVAEIGAQQELIRGQSQLDQANLRAGAIKGSQRAALAANGVVLTEGSAPEILTSTDVMKTVDDNTITMNALRAAWGYRTQETNDQNDALMKRAGAAGISPMGAAATSLLGSAGSVASTWYGMNKTGAGKTSGDDPLGDFGKQKGWW